MMEADAAFGIVLNQRPKAMHTFLVIASVQRFADDAPLHGDFSGVRDRQRFIERPACRAVVDDNVLAAPAHRNRIRLKTFPLYFIFITQPITRPETHIAHNHIVRTDNRFVVLKTNPTARGVLTCEGKVRLGDIQSRLKRYCP